MKSLILSIFFVSSSLYAQVKLPDDLSTLNNEPFLISQSRDFNISLFNGFCENGKILSKESVLAGITFYQANIGKVIDDVRKLIPEIPGASLQAFEKMLPLEIHLSVDGDVDCDNAVTVESTIRFPLTPEPGYFEYYLEMFQHEIGHTLAYAHKYKGELYAESIGDMVSVLLRKEFGVFGWTSVLNLKKYDDRLQEAESDPVAYSKKYEVPVADIPLIMNLEKTIAKCSSNLWNRDFTKDLGEDFFYHSGAESHVVSCWLTSNIMANSANPFTDLKKALGLLLTSPPLGLSIQDDLEKIGVKISGLSIAKAKTQEVGFLPSIQGKAEEKVLKLKGNKKILDATVTNPVYLAFEYKGRLVDFVHYLPSYGLNLYPMDSCDEEFKLCICPATAKDWVVKAYGKDSEFFLQKLVLPKTTGCFEI